jgi:hypothetical protein
MDPAIAEVPGVHPASITNGAPTIVASGVTAEDLRHDITTIFAFVCHENLNIKGAYWIMGPVQALSIGMMVNPLGQPEFPGINMNGGMFYGLPVITSMNVPHHDGTDIATDPATSQITLVLPPEILLADDGGVTLDATREASLELSTTPVGGAQQLVSLWQNNMIALRAERFINWQRRRPEAVSYISGAQYGGPIIVPAH